MEIFSWLLFWYNRVQLEMEKDAMIGYGAAFFLKERLFECSDFYATYVCASCGHIAQRMLRRDNKPYETQNDIWFCKKCKNSTVTHKIRIPYAFKQLYHELMSMNIAMTFKVKESKFNQ